MACLSWSSPATPPRTHEPCLERIARPPLQGSGPSRRIRRPGSPPRAVRRRPPARATVLRGRLWLPRARGHDDRRAGRGGQPRGAARGARRRGTARRSGRSGRDGVRHRSDAERRDARGVVRGSRARCAPASSTGRTPRDWSTRPISSPSDIANAHRHRRARAVRARDRRRPVSRRVAPRMGDGERGGSRHEFILYAPEPLARRRSTRGGLRSAWCRASPARGGSRCVCRPWRRRIISTSSSRRPTRRRFGCRCRLSWRSTTSRSSRIRSGFGPREGLRRRWLTRQSAARARAVVTISDFSRREILDALGVPDGPRPRHSPRRDDGAGDGRRIAARSGSSLSARSSTVGTSRTWFDRSPSSPRRRPSASLDLVGDNRTYPHEDLPRCDCGGGPRRSNPVASLRRRGSADGAVRTRAGLCVSVGVRRAGPDAARSAGRGCAAGAPRHAGRSRKLRRRGALRLAGDVEGTARALEDAAGRRGDAVAAALRGAGGAGTLRLAARRHGRRLAWSSSLIVRSIRS